MKLLSLFSGIGAFEKALDRKDIHYNLVNYCEFDNILFNHLSSGLFQQMRTVNGYMNLLIIL